MHMDRQGEAHKDSDRETSHCFSGRVLPRKTAECRSVRPLPSLELVTHKTHKCCQTGAYRTLNKRGHIPGVFPHEVTSCSKGRMGCWEFTGDLLRRTLPPPKVLSALFMFFPQSLPLPPHYFHLSIHLYLPVLLAVSLPVELWISIYCIVTLISHDMTSITAEKQPVAVVLRQSFALCVS